MMVLYPKGSQPEPYGSRGGHRIVSEGHRIFFETGSYKNCQKRQGFFLDVHIVPFLSLTTIAIYLHNVDIQIYVKKYKLK